MQILHSVAMSSASCKSPDSPSSSAVVPLAVLPAVVDPAVGGASACRELLLRRLLEFEEELGACDGHFPSERL